MLTCFARMPDGSFEHHDSLDAVCRLGTECESSLWIDLEAPDGDLLQRVGGLFNVTPEALEDCTNVESTHAMNLEIVTSNGRLDEDFRQDVEQRLHNGLLRFENRIVRATVSFLDLSGPYGAEQQ